MTAIDLGTILSWPAATHPDLPPQLPPGPWQPRTDDDPKGLRYDRDDRDDTTTAKAGDGWPAGHHSPLITVPLKDCCGLPVGDVCRCACLNTIDRIELDAAPVYVMRPFNLRDLADRGITAVELDRIERRAA